MQLEALKASDANPPDLVSEKQCSHKKKSSIHKNIISRVYFCSSFVKLLIVENLPAGFLSCSIYRLT
jgi:hypothetical protein